MLRRVAFDLLGVVPKRTLVGLWVFTMLVTILLVGIDAPSPVVALVFGGVGGTLGAIYAVELRPFRASGDYGVMSNEPTESDRGERLRLAYGTTVPNADFSAHTYLRFAMAQLRVAYHEKQAGRLAEAQQARKRALVSLDQALAQESNPSIRTRWIAEFGKQDRSIARAQVRRRRKIKPRDSHRYQAKGQHKKNRD
jgi:hypothetical protein